MLLDFAGTAETFHMAAQRGAGYRLHYVAPSRRVPSSIGLALGGVAPLPRRLPERALVMVPGVADSAVDYQHPDAEAAVRWLARAVEPGRGHVLCTVCSGVFLAARAGLLRDRTCTAHHQLTQRLAREHPDLTVLENRIFVRDGPVFTSAGVTTGIDLALHLIAEDAGPQVALDVARTLVIYFRRSEADPQLSPWLLHRNHIHPGIHRAQDAVIRNPAQGWTLDELAAQALTSPRHLARLFRTHAGISPLAYVRKVRTASARDILRQDARLNLERVAEMAGFSSAEQMRRAWRRFEGRNPVDARRASAAAS